MMTPGPACSMGRCLQHQSCLWASASPRLVWFFRFAYILISYPCLPFPQLLVSGPKPVVSNIVSLQFLKLLVVIISKFCVQSYFLSIIVRQDLLKKNTIINYKLIKVYLKPRDHFLSHRKSFLYLTGSL